MRATSDDTVRAEVERLINERVRADDGDELQGARSWLAQLATLGWSTPSWPVEYGGCGAPPAEAERIRAIVRDYPVNGLDAFGVGLQIVGPALMASANADQCARFLPRMARGEILVVQMFSEPDAGSDIANAAMSAVQDGELWHLSGQKVWTSYARAADFGWCLARTDPSQPKHRGLTMFMVGLKQPTVRIDPITQLDRNSSFSQIALSDTPVPDADRVGTIGTGWSVARATLAVERNAISASEPAAELAVRAAPPWLKRLSEEGLISQPVMRERAIRAYIAGVMVTLGSARERLMVEAQPSIGSLGKLRAVHYHVALGSLLKDSAGAHGLLVHHVGHEEFLRMPSSSIRGGSSEIQRNIIGEQILGLPREPDPDREAPWSSTRRGGPARGR